MTEFKDYVAPLIKWWWLILMTMILAGATSYLATSQEPSTYQSRTTLLIGSAIDDPNPTNSQFSLGQQLAQTYADMARRQPIREASMKNLGLDWLPEYSVRADSQLIEIVVNDTNPARAQATANELANQLINISPSGLQQEEQDRLEFINDQLVQLQAQIEETEAELEEKQKELGGLFSAGQIEETQNDIAALEAKRNDLQSTYASYLSTTQQGAINSLTIIEPASLPSAPIGPQHTTTMLTAVAIAFALTAGAAYVFEYIDDTIKTAADIHRSVNLPTIGAIAKFSKKERENPLVTTSDLQSPHSEAFRILRTGIHFAEGRNNRQTIMITSAIMGEGKSTIAANLGVVLAQTGLHVLLIDADLRRPTQHKIFNLIGEIGLTNLLLSPTLTPSPEKLDKLFDGLIQATSEPRLSLLASGPIPQNPSELLGSQKMRLILSALLSRFDLILLDSSPALAVTDPVVLSGSVDGVLVVVNAGKTRRRFFEQAITRIKEVGGNIIGVTLNNIRPNSSAYGNYYHTYEPLEEHEKVGEPSVRTIISKN